MKSVPAEVLRRAAPECRYIVTDEMAVSYYPGSRRSAPKRVSRSTSRDRLPPGRYTLAAVIAVNGNVMNAEIKRIPVVGCGAISAD